MTNLSLSPIGAGWFICHSSFVICYSFVPSTLPASRLMERAAQTNAQTQKRLGAEASAGRPQRGLHSAEPKPPREYRFETDRPCRIPDVPAATISDPNRERCRRVLGMMRCELDLPAE